MNLKPYSNSGRGEAAAYKNVPIAYREEVLAYYRKKKYKNQTKISWPTQSSVSASTPGNVLIARC